MTESNKTSHRYSNCVSVSLCVCHPSARLIASTSAEALFKTQCTSSLETDGSLCECVMCNCLNCHANCQLDDVSLCPEISLRLVQELTDAIDAYLVRPRVVLVLSQNVVSPDMPRYPQLSNQISSV